MRSFPGKGIAQRAVNRTDRFVARAAAPFRHYDIALFHEFAPAPAGGGHQFLRALKREWERRGLRVEVNSISKTTRACLLNSFNFDAERFRYLRRAGCRIVHRVDGPLATYRGFDDGTDLRIAEWNLEFAQATILQSAFSLRAHAERGLVLRDPIVVPNAADPEIFHPPVRWDELRGRKLRVVSTSWSDNPNKGADVYAWLDRNLNFDRVDYTFVGRLPAELKNVRVLPPMPSRKLAELLRKQDVYLTASRNDPCSNSLVEALACGLPAIYLNSGGHPEIAGESGLAFERAEEIPALLERLAAEIVDYRGKNRVSRITDVAERYLKVLGFVGDEAI